MPCIPEKPVGKRAPCQLHSRFRINGESILSVASCLTATSIYRTTRYFVDHLVLGALSDELTVGTGVFEEESSGLLRDVAG